MQLTKQQVIDFANEIGIDLIGFASRDRFNDVPAERNPFSIAPEAKTVIMIGKCIPRGAFRGIEEGTNFEDFKKFGIRWLDQSYNAEGCYNLVRFIEDHGKEAVPIVGIPEEAMGYGIPVREGAPAPDVVPDFNYAATACGLGTVGLNGLFLSKKFGPRQRLQMIITEAEFDSDPLVEKNICDECKACIKSCPLEAISDETSEFTVCGLTVPVAKINNSICNLCKNGAFKSYISDLAKPERCAASCSRSCMIHLEEKGLIENTFDNKFRNRNGWALTADGTKIDPYKE